MEPEHGNLSNNMLTLRSIAVKERDQVVHEMRRTRTRWMFEESVEIAVVGGNSRNFEVMGGLVGHCRGSSQVIGGNFQAIEEIFGSLKKLYDH